MFGEREFGEEVSDEIEGSNKGSGVRAGGTADGGLVGEDEFLDVFDAGDGVVCAGLFLGFIEMLAEGFGEDTVDEGGFPGAGGAGDDGDLLKGDFYCQIVEIMFARSVNGDFGFWILGFGFSWDESWDFSA